MGGTWFGLDRHYSHAWDKREQLEQQFGPRAEYQPGAGPTVSKADLDRFLAIRRALVPQCTQATNNNARIAALEQFDGVENAPKSAILKQSLVSISGMFHTAKGLGDFALARNQALLDQGMGYGQYTWIYVMTYYAGLAQTPILGMSENSPGNMPSGARDAVLRMMAAKVDSLQARANAAVDPQGQAHWRATAQLWSDEHAAMTTDRSRLPFAAGSPADLTTAIEPKRDTLLDYFCPATDALELMLIKEHGVGYEDR